MIITVLFYTLIALQIAHLWNLALPIIRSERPKGKENPTISILIAARNELSNLKKLLPLLFDQKYPNYEVVVALDRCTDDSIQYLHSLESDHRNLKILNINQVPEGFDPKKNAISLGIDSCSGEWILLTDADCQPHSSNWITSFASSIGSDVDILIGVSPYKKQASILNQFIQYETIYTASKYISAALRKKPYMAVGRNLAYKKDLFLSKDGFDPYQGITGGDDDLFIQKYANGQNTNVVLGKQSLTTTVAPQAVKAYVLQKLRHLNVGKHYKHKSIHVYWTLIHALLWLGFISLMIMDQDDMGVIVPFILLIVIKGLIFNLLSRKMGYYYNPFFLPISDLIYSVLYPFLGIGALLLRKVKWK